MSEDTKYATGLEFTADMLLYLGILVAIIGVWYAFENGFWAFNIFWCIGTIIFVVGMYLEKKIKQQEMKEANERQERS